MSSYYLKLMALCESCSNTESWCKIDVSLRNCVAIRVNSGFRKSGRLKGVSKEHSSVISHSEQQYRTEEIRRNIDFSSIDLWKI